MKPCYSWWFDSHNSPRQSPWLLSTLSDEKTKAMVKLIEQDADSFAQRAEMYYRKRPELVYMVEDFYRAHRSLAERYDQLKREANTRLVTIPSGSSFSSKNSSRNFKNLTDKSSTDDCHSFDSKESEVDDTEHEEAQVDIDMGEEVSSKDTNGHLSLAKRYNQLKLEAGTRLMTMPSGSHFSSKDTNGHLSLAKRYNQLKLEAGTRLMTMPSGSHFSSKNSSQNLKNLTDKSSTASSYSFDSEESEVDDPEQDEAQEDREMGEEVSSKVSSKDTYAHRSLAEQYNQLKVEASTQLMTIKNLSQKCKEVTDKSSIASPVSFDSEESEVDDPEEEETQASSKDSSGIEVMMKLREEIERLREENRIHKTELMEKNEEKREVIRQLCMSIDILKEENFSLRKCRKDSKKSSLFEFSKLKGVFSGKLFGGYPKFQPTVAL
ncbi:uncharacterized protein LOC143869864 isoform X2 [Tasmannia lanceolata]|uniref:uncharacterized protein LOC143869864 isoform X2 n=1 Tax=Tasmannia lanceolata TaxID=3420 RepID=UPI00406327CB